ncbi:hypothetical protein [Archangium primigenium]|uniref:hypothetical protein n=1 Tax=[Archangium] primigenium TaxID=2792470 RepID=UPI00195D038E|nr:hypothetical protein [Archangium primigenium]MBM7116436.1 hypothetical protein [Archangium primigenium]
MSSLVLLLSGEVFAAGDAPRLARLEARGDGEEDLRAEARPPMNRGVRILAEVGMGGLVALGGGFVGGAVGLGLCETVGLGRKGHLPCLGTTLLGAGAGIAAGYGLGVWTAGERLDGDGRLWAALLGTGLGVGLGLPLIEHVGGASPFVLGAVGGVLGYELSQAEVPASGEALALTRPRLVPVVSFSRDGGLVGMSGRF